MSSFQYCRLARSSQLGKEEEEREENQKERTETRRTEMPSKNSKPVTSFLFGGTGADGGTISVMVREVFLNCKPAT